MMRRDTPRRVKERTEKSFYMRCAEFIEYPKNSRTLFLPIETVIAIFS